MHPVLFQMKPNLQRPEPTRKLGAVFTKPGIATGKPTRRGCQILRPEGKSLAVQIFTADQNASGIILHMHPFMEIKCNGIGALNTGETGFESVIHRRDCTKGPIHMEPQIMLLTDL